MKQSTVGVYIGRFQPLHIGHQFVIDNALKQVDRLIVVIGSANCARSPQNPFTAEERLKLFHAIYPQEIADNRMSLLTVGDHPFDDMDWVTEVVRGVAKLISDLDVGKIVLAGYGKDSSSYYLDLFPTWGSIQIDTQHGTINASNIRYDYLRDLPRYSPWAVHPLVNAFLQEFALTPAFKQLSGEAAYYRDYRTEWGKGPFVTVDNLIVWDGKILLVRRGKTPGKGLLALPGGFLENHETILEGALRELREETGLALLNMRSFLRHIAVVDTPERSLRGRVISHVHIYEIPAHAQLPAVAGADDAAEAGWFDINSLKPEEFFEDHYHIIQRYA